MNLYYFRTTFSSNKKLKFSIEDLLEIPGRFMRPPKVVIVLRGLPGSGKTTIAKMIKVSK